MASRPETTQKAKGFVPESFEFGIENRKDYPASGKPDHEIEPQKIITGYMSPACEHDWLKLADDFQTLESEGKTIWKCRTCDEITNTYSWQTP
jgi:hypothetical protein